MSKMKTNVASHFLPMPKIYSVLSPPREDLDDVLVFIYLGPNVPTEKDYKRTLMLVKRNKVAIALEWPKLNHVNYADLHISYHNLNSYPEDESPVIVNFTKAAGSNQDAESTVVNNLEKDEGTEEGKCPFIAHGLTRKTL